MRFLTLSAAVVSTVAALGMALALAAVAASSAPGQASPSDRRCMPHPDPATGRPWTCCWRRRRR
ncbi:hypothetical protein AB0395_45210 [Streptosporangium sp. NPDC051023]|uniref:hypothetical protein n=1 Tax=Streptosporangium sp. NPDC051023 TaxID=3155410 RepID=UPI00344B25CE